MVNFSINFEGQGFLTMLVIVIDYGLFPFMQTLHLKPVDLTSTFPRVRDCANIWLAL